MLSVDLFLFLYCSCNLYGRIQKNIDVTHYPRSRPTEFKNSALRSSDFFFLCGLPHPHTSTICFTFAAHFCRFSAFTLFFHLLFIEPFSVPQEVLYQKSRRYHSSDFTPDRPKPLLFSSELFFALDLFQGVPARALGEYRLHRCGSPRHCYLSLSLYWVTFTSGSFFDTA